jgi:hypothetical protein
MKPFVHCIDEMIGDPLTVINPFGKLSIVKSKGVDKVCKKNFA